MRNQILAAGLALAALTTQAAVDSGPRSVARVEVSEAFFTVYFADAGGPNDGCQQTDKVVFWRADFSGSYKEFLSVALVAAAGNKKVSMWFNGCKLGPWGATLPKPESIVVING